MEKSIIEVILQYGGLGAVLIIVGWAYFKKDLAIASLNKDILSEQQKRIEDGRAYAISLREEQQKRVEDGKLYSKALQDEQQKRVEDGRIYAKALQEEQQLRIEDAKSYLALAMKLQESVISAVNKLSDIVEVFEKRESAREERRG